MEDLKDYLEDLTLVGGWLSFVYSRFLWKIPGIKPIITTDIDFGFGSIEPSKHSNTIFQTLNPLDYTEHHVMMPKLYPVLMYKGGKIPIDFITSPSTSNQVIENLIGRQIFINKVKHFNFLLKHRFPLIITLKKKKSYTIYCPKPSAFLYYKAATFIFREDQFKIAKDLFYIYFILRYAPDIEHIVNEITHYECISQDDSIQTNLRKYFERKSSQGCLLVEKENGPDEYIRDVRQDIYERFSRLLHTLDNK